MEESQIKLIRYSEENKNVEALKGKWGNLGTEWGYVTAVKNLLFVIVYADAQINEYKLPEVYDGFLICSDGTTVPVTDSTINLSLADGVSAQGVLKLKKDN